MINDIIRVFGSAEKVQVLQSKLFTKKPTADNAQMGVLFKSGAITNIYASYCGSDDRLDYRKMIINFENRNVFVDKYDLKSGGELSLKVISDNEEAVIEHCNVIEVSGDYQWERFYEIFSGKLNCRMRDSYEIIIESMKILVAMKKAGISNRTEYVNDEF